MNRRIGTHFGGEGPRAEGVGGGKTPPINVTKGRWVGVYLGVFGRIWMHFDVFGRIWDIWAHLGVFKCIWAYLDVFGFI